MAKLIITTKNGRHRKEHPFEITTEEATDPIKRASVISAKSAMFDKVVIWRIEE
jgi:hypothetical protein